MKKTFISIAIASTLAVSSVQVMADQYEENTNNEQNYTAIGIGAASGALVAGPAGLIIGGVVGSLFGKDEVEDVAEADQQTTESESSALLKAQVNDSSEDLVFASSSNDILIEEPDLPEEVNRIKQIVANDLNVAVYFKPGSVNFESFYSHQFSTIARLLHEMPEMEVTLEGYSDRQGTQADNLKLAEERLESVRDYFINSGIDASRINVHAYGEKNFLSTPGELDSYMFDRRVVVSFKAPANNSHNNVAKANDASSL